MYSAVFRGIGGHTLGASGPIELIACLMMMHRNVILPTNHLENVADDCAGIQHVREIRQQPLRRFLKNSFAFGGINAAMVIAAVSRLGLRPSWLAVIPNAAHHGPSVHPKNMKMALLAHELSC